jgi:hypothetical protein
MDREALQAKTAVAQKVTLTQAFSLGLTNSVT